MITFLHGKLVDALPTQVTVDVNGVGYEVLIPLSSFTKLPPRARPCICSHPLGGARRCPRALRLHDGGRAGLVPITHQHVSGIGPKIALNVLSGMSVTMFRGAVAGADVKSLSQISGVGRKRRSALSLS